MTPPPDGGPPSPAASGEAASGEAALFEIVPGEATAEEIAALTAVLAAAAAAGHRDAVPAPEPARLSGWADRSRLLRNPLGHSAGGWRASARPR